jgi:hypothetical protein
MAMTHHGMIEHYAGQAASGSMAVDYVIRDWETVSRILAEAGLGLVFTGHFHAQDITEKTWDVDGVSVRMTDVETGSLVTYPSPYRVVTLNRGGEAVIQSHRITEIGDDAGGVSFPQYAETFLTDGLIGMYTALLSAPADQGGFGLPADQARGIAGRIADALKAHYAGDELPDRDTLDAINAYLQSGDPTAQLIGGNLTSLWTDLPPADNAARIAPASPMPASAGIKRNYRLELEKILLSDLRRAVFNGRSGS